MDDKTLRPSTVFGDSSSASTTHIHSLAQFQSSTPPTTSYQSTTINSIVSPNNPNTNMERKNPMDIKNTLMSPPEAIPQDSFCQPQSDNNMKSAFTMPAGRFQPPLSPPVSPETKNGHHNDPHTTVIRDPILFPISDKSRSPSQPPLFPVDDAQRVVDEHIKAVPQSFFQKTSRPRNEDYTLLYQIKATNIALYASKPRIYAVRELNYLREDDKARRLAAPLSETPQRNPQRKYHAIAPATGIRAPVKNRGRTNGSGGVVKLPRQTKSPRDRGATPDGSKRQPRDDSDFNSLPDYCPPLDSLPAKNHSLKVEWKAGQPRDLKNDPNAHLLHPDEVHLAAVLRLDCATYLTSKRRVFISRLNAFKIGKTFRKTDAQQACKIDVNKASKLWSAFDKVGWLEADWVKQYL